MFQSFLGQGQNHLRSEVRQWDKQIQAISHSKFPKGHIVSYMLKLFPISEPCQCFNIQMEEKKRKEAEEKKKRLEEEAREAKRIEEDQRKIALEVEAEKRKEREKVEEVGFCPFNEGTEGCNIAGLNVWLMSNYVGTFFFFFHFSFFCF